MSHVGNHLRVFSVIYNYEFVSVLNFAKSVKI